MKTILTLLSVVSFQFAVAQWTTSGANIYYNTGAIGIGTSTPTSLLDVRGGFIHVVNPAGSGAYTFVARNGNPGVNESYFYHLMSADYHILGSNENGSGTVKNIGFAFGGIDTQSDIKIAFKTNGAVAIGTTDDGGSRLTVAEGNGGEQIRLKRGTGIVRFAQDENKDNLYLYNSTGNIYMSWRENGNVGIGTDAPGTYKLAVEGKVGAREVVVTNSSWSDYVFKPDYKLRPLSEVQSFITANGHLPEVPSEKEVIANGQNLGEVNAILLKKIEELTLYLIEQQSEIDELKKAVKK